MQKRYRILAWSDGVAKTGFGIVAHKVLKALYDTGRYEIEQIAINYHGTFVDKAQWPWQLVPAKLLQPDDPYGIAMFIKALAENDYDFVWILNDVPVVQKALGSLREVLDRRRGLGLKVPLVILYYPVDCKVIPTHSEIIKFVDIPVCYNRYGREQTLKVLPEVKDKLHEIPHGVDTNVYRPLSQEEVHSIRVNWLHIDPEMYLIININRNSPRKQLAKAIWAFKEFRKKVPKSMMYLHTSPQDRGTGTPIDLYAAVADLGLSIKTDIIFPVGYSPNHAFSEEDLNKVYNAGDVFFSPHTGEGHGLSQHESMSAGTPVVLPDNTNTRELLGDNEERGYVYSCKEACWIDNSGFRKEGRTEDMVHALLRAYIDPRKTENDKVRAAREWCLGYTWDKVTKQWVEFFDRLSTVQPSHEYGIVL